MLDYIFFGVLSLATTTALITFTQLRANSYRYLTLLLILTLINEYWCFYLITGKIATLPYYNIYFYLRGLIVTSIFYHYLKKYTSVKVLYFISSRIIVLLLPICFFLYNGLNNLHGLAAIVIGFFILLYCLMYFYFDYRRDDVSKPHQQPLFFSTVAFTVYFLYMLPYLTMYNYILKNSSELLIVNRYIAKTLSIFLYSFIALDFYLQWKRKSLEY